MASALPGPCSGHRTAPSSAAPRSASWTSASLPARRRRATAAAAAAAGGEEAECDDLLAAATESHTVASVAAAEVRLMIVGGTSCCAAFQDQLCELTCELTCPHLALSPALPRPHRPPALSSMPLWLSQLLHPPCWAACCTPPTPAPLGPQPRWAAPTAAAGCGRPACCWRRAWGG